MALPRGYVRNPENWRFVPPGATVHRESYSFLRGGALPAGWATANSLTSIASPAAAHGGVAQSASEDGYYRVATAATVGAAALLHGPVTSANVGRCAGMYLEFSGLRFSAASAASLTARMGLGLAVLSGGEGGGYWEQGGGAEFGSFYPRGVAATPVPTYYTVRTGGEPNLPRTMGFLLLPETREVVLTEGGIDYPVAWARFSGMTLGNLRPQLWIVSNDGAEHEIRVSTLTLTTWQH